MGRTPYCDKNGVKKGTWTPEEDKKLVDYITRYGHWNWRLLPKFAGLARCGKSCRLRWLNYLRPNLKRGNYTSEEEDTIIKLHKLLGNRWSTIAAEMPGRTDNEIKNHWHTNLKKRFHHNYSVTKAKVSNKSKNHKTANNIVGSFHQNVHTNQLADSYSSVTNIENQVPEVEFPFLYEDISPMIENFWLEETYMVDISCIQNEISSVL